MATTTLNRIFTTESRQYMIEYGRNDDGNRVLRGFMRLDSRNNWRPVFEIDMDNWFQEGDIFYG